MAPPAGFLGTLILDCSTQKAAAGIIPIVRGVCALSTVRSIPRCALFHTLASMQTSSCKNLEAFSIRVAKLLAGEEKLATDGNDDSGAEGAKSGAQPPFQRFGFWRGPRCGLEYLLGTYFHDVAGSFGRIMPNLGGPTLWTEAHGDS